MEKIYITDENDQPHRADYVARASLESLTSLEQKGEGSLSNEDYVAYMKAATELDTAYYLLAKKDNAKLMTMEELQKRIKEPEDAKTAGKDIYSSKKMINEYSIFSQTFRFIMTLLRFFAIPFLLCVITGGWFGRSWNVISNITLWLMIGLTVMLPILSQKKFAETRNFFGIFETSFETLRSRYVEVGEVNESVITTFMEIKQRNPQLFDQAEERQTP